MKKNNEFTDFYNKIIKRHYLSLGLVCLIFVILNQVNIALGFLVGGVLAGLFFRTYFVKLKNLPVDFPLKKIFSLFFVKYLVIYSLIAIFLFVAMKKDISIFIGMACGLLAIKLQVFLAEVGARK